MINIYIIINRKNGNKYLGFDTLPINKIWKNILEKYQYENTTLYSTMNHIGIEHFTIKIVEEYYGKDIDSRMEYWIDKYKPEYNTDIIGYEIKPAPPRKKKYNKNWMNKRRPKTIRRKCVIKCRNVETGKLKTLHGWDEVESFCNGYRANIIQAMKRNGTAYGYEWWFHQKIDIKRPVYGINKDGDKTKTFDCIADAMRAFGYEDRCKGICTSIKWNREWCGYKWYYASEE